MTVTNSVQAQPHDYDSAQFARDGIERDAIAHSMP
jgi:hypothetical protein